MERKGVFSRWRGWHEQRCVCVWWGRDRRVQGLFRGWEKVCLKGSLGAGREQKQVRWVRLYPPGCDAQPKAAMNE